MARRLLSLLAGVLWVIVPLVAAVVLVVRADEVTTAPTDESTWVPVGPEVSSVDTQVTVGLTWSDQPPLVAPAWSGIVERIDIAPGRTVASGDVIARIGGIERLLVASPAPFGRPLQLGDEGPDVTALNEVLVALGHPAGRRDSYDERARAGVRALGERLGVETDVFDPGWFVYTTSPAVTVASVDLLLAAPAPASGTPIATPRPALVAATVAGSSPSGPGVVVIADQEVASVAADGTIDLVGLAAALDPSATTVDAVLRHTPTELARQVPADSVVTAADGSSCVLTRPRAGSEVEATPVTVLGSRLGVATVTGLGGDDDVLVDPGADQRSRC